MGLPRIGADECVTRSELIVPMAKKVRRMAVEEMTATIAATATLPAAWSSSLLLMADSRGYHYSDFWPQPEAPTPYQHSFFTRVHWDFVFIPWNRRCGPIWVRSEIIIVLAPSLTVSSTTQLSPENFNWDYMTNGTISPSRFSLLSQLLHAMLSHGISWFFDLGVFWWLKKLPDLNNRTNINNRNIIFV